MRGGARGDGGGEGEGGELVVDAATRTNPVPLMVRTRHHEQCKECKHVRLMCMFTHGYTSVLMHACVLILYYAHGCVTLCVHV